MHIKANSKVLFQGDSITDCGRGHEDLSNLGYGYSMMAAAWFNSLYSELNVNFINRGVGGNRVKDLRERWDKDCMALKPDVVSILIGINDTWRRFDSNDHTTAEAYMKDYRYILQQIKDNLQSTVIICEPFVLPVKEEQRRKWREDLDPKIHVARQLSREFNTLYVPLDGIFAQACTRRSPSFWAEDGVHPTPAGHVLIARSWLETIKAL